MKETVYGYCRISTKEQSIERQARNIKEVYPDATIVREVYTGRNIANRAELTKLIKKVKTGDTIVFDEVSRMARNAEEGIELYHELYDKEINLVFLKEPHINSDTYKDALCKEISLTGDIIDNIFEGINKYMKALAKQQIKLAFSQAEKEVLTLRQRTAEGIKTAKLNGKQIGNIKGAKLITKKSIEAKKGIIEYSKDFQGNLADAQVIKLVGITRNSYYKYKKELKAELAN